MSRRSNACEFDPKTRRIIRQRDKGCVFCQIPYHLPDEPQMIYDIVHIVNRSQGGLGIEQNGVFGCRYHHMMLDNGNEGRRQEMQDIIEWYMKQKYPGWSRGKLVYRKEFTD